MAESAAPLVEKRFHALGVSPGIARGVVYVHRSEDEEEIPFRRIDESEIPSEIARLESSLIATRKEILEMQEKIAGSIGAKDAGIFDAHLLVVEDRTLIDEVLRTLERDRITIDGVYQQVANRYAKTLSEIDDPYLRERAMDIHDVTRRVLRNLSGKAAQALSELTTPHILVAHNLTPSDTALLNRNFVLGFATSVGSKTSHTAIMARALNIPAVVGLQDITEVLVSGDQILLDGYTGLLIVNPNDLTLWEYGEMEVKKGLIEEQLTGLKETSSTTIDGHHIMLSANIELPEEVENVKESGAEGIGLYRTEFFYINKSEIPDEEEQYLNYLSVAQQLHPAPVIIRTLDLGGDKFMSALGLPKELNPFLGLRAIRFCLEQPEIFRLQLRAILRASVGGNVRMMFPMISGIDELRRAKALLNTCRDELRSEGKAFNEKMEVGVMIEVPSAAITADILAREVDFFSIGTNDLIQYSIAVDRVNERISHLYEPTHPAIIRLIKRVVDAGHAHNIWIGICGEMAGEITLTPLLIGLGVDELSVGASMVPRVKRAIRALDMGECLQLVEDVTRIDTSQEILARCEEIARKHYPELIS